MENKHKLRHRFDIVRKLGQGTYGKVQLAINKGTGQEVAIKTIKKSKIENEQDAVRIRREIQIMSSIRHPNIVHIYEVFENKDKIVLVMQNASGGELYEYLSERKVLPDAEARRIFRQVVAAVYYIHKNKICHRDLKLENILLDEKGNAKIADFGLSNVYDEKCLLSTFCGSPLYASPEIVKGLPYYGPEVDCWSLGVLLYTLAYGAMPFDGSNFKKLVKQISNGDYYEPKQRASASALIKHLLTVNVLERATIIDVCKNDWVNETYETQLLQVAEDLANLSPVRLDLLIALQPQPSAQTPPASEAQLNQSVESSQIVPTDLIEQPHLAGVHEEASAQPEQIVPSSSLMRMPLVSVRSSASFACLRSSSSTSSMKSTSNCKVNEAAATNDFDDAESTLSSHSFQCATPSNLLIDEASIEPNKVTVHTEEKLPQKSISRATIELKPKNLERLTLSEAPSETASNDNVLTSDTAENRAADSSLVENSASTAASLQEVQIVSKKAESLRNKQDPDLGDSAQSLVWPIGAASRKLAGHHLSPQGSADNLILRKNGQYLMDTNETQMPRGLPMKSYKKFTFERNGGQVVVRERICQKEQQDGNKKILIEKKVTSKTSTTFDAPLSDGLESIKSRKGDDSSDEDDFDLHFDSSHGPMGLLNVMKFMDRDFRLRWQNHPVFQNFSKRPLGITSELLQGNSSQRFHSPSLMKLFIDRDPSSARDDDINRSFAERRHPSLLGRYNDSSPFSSVSDVRSAADRKLSRGSSLDRSSLRSARTQPLVQPDLSSGSVSKHSDDHTFISSRNIPRYTRTVSDKTMNGESQLQSSSLKTKTRNHQGRPPFAHVDSGFNNRPPATFGLTHSWSNHGLWQQQNQQLHQSASGGSPSRLEMRVHYAASPTTPPTTPPIGMPLKPPKADRERRSELANPTEESVSDRINRRSYYHRFSSVDRQLNTRPTSTIWDQQTGSMSAGALWEAASPDKPLGSPRSSVKTPPTLESNTTSM